MWLNNSKQLMIEPNVPQVYFDFLRILNTNFNYMITPEELMTKFANKHSYNTWDELMYDCHPHSQIEYTKRVMLIYARIQVKKLNIPEVITRSSYLGRTWEVNDEGEISSSDFEDEGIVLYNFMSWNFDKLPKDISQRIVDVLNGL